MARVAMAFGIKGWVKLHAFTASDDGLGEFTHWWVEEQNPKLGWTLRKVEAFEVKPNGILVKFEGCDDRTTSEAMRGRGISIPRSELAPLEEDEHYQADMVGYQVHNIEGHSFGVVDGFIETGANDVMVAKHADGTERLIPVVDHVMVKIDAEAKQVTVDWQLDY